jgi:pimeloyl-ACP methyl ester carboxylesterase
VRTIEIAGRQLEYGWIGPPSPRQRSLVFLHEGLGCAAMWRTFAAALCERTGLPGLLYSRWGYGGSEPVDRPWGPRFLHDEALETLPALLAHFEIDAPVLVGHSDGATIALIYAGSAIGGVRALALEAPHVFVEDITRPGIRRVVDGFAGSELRRKLLVFHGTNTDPVLHAWSDAWLSSTFDTWNIESELAGITCPVLVVQGLDDEYGTAEQVERIRRGVSGPVTTMLLEDCGHTPHRDKREVVLEAMAALVRRAGDGE